MRKQRLFTAVLISTIVWTTNGHAQALRDIISVRGGGRSVSGTVTSASPDEVTVETSTGLTTVPVPDIVRISLGDDPPGFGSVRSAAEAGQLEQAESQLEKISVGDARDIVKQDIEFHRAFVQSRLALKGVGDVTDAAKELNAFLRQYPASFRVYAAWEVMGDLAASLGKFDAAASAYGKLVNAKLPATRARGFLLQGYALLHKGGTTEALSRFEEVARLEGDRTQALGAIGAAVCQARGGNADQAVEQIQKIIAENDASDVELFAKAYNALGECYELAEKNEDAILAFLHTDLLFYRDYDAHAQALFHLSKLWAEVNKPTDASKARQLLKDRYAATSWAKRQ